jgi:hypothetical protein
MLKRLQAVAAGLKAAGAVSMRLIRPAEDVEGQPSRDAMLCIDTNIPRPATVGGGTVAFRGHFHATEHHDVLNLALTLFCDAMADVSLLAATFRNAIEDRDRAIATTGAAEMALARTLDGRSGMLWRGELLVVIDEVRGGAWLQDPDKGDSGIGFYFDSLASLWRAHPNLRPVRWADGRLICASFAIGGAT